MARVASTVAGRLYRAAPTLAEGATPARTGVVVLSMSDVPLGFGVTARSTAECRATDPTAIVVFHQADVGEYLRAEDDL